MRVLTKYISETLLETFLQSTSFEFSSIYKAKLTTFNQNFGYLSVLNPQNCQTLQSAVMTQPSTPPPPEKNDKK